MKKWHLEGVVHRAAPRKIILPDSCRTPHFLYTGPADIRKEHKVKIYCRQVAAFLIRFL
ncbi:MAG: hypothetical protein KKD01_11360 [Proteobacteria bacterium]|nr:hypothetical protein [Pseudomonadota bacterium]MBU1231242.1 hypothetical protein [Pseudomonadota bacterium]MBU1417361.1 hypothetical protein [Pseudomonadota bacterium]MBU1455314.1 hypothetical protein [Pseudomonadota bacterium]